MPKHNQYQSDQMKAARKVAGQKAKTRAQLRRQELERQMRLAGKAAGERTTGRYAELPAKDIVRPANYQRPFNEDAAIEIALAFDWDAFDNVNVTERVENDKTIYEYRDGQHRLQGAMLAKGEDVVVPCMVYPSRGNVRDAWVFNRINIDRRSLAAADKWNSRRAEQDAYVTEVEHILSNHGLKATPTRGKSATQPGEVSAVGALEQMLKTGGAESVDEVIGLLYDTFGDAHQNYRDFIMRGLWTFVLYFPDYRRERLRQVMLRAALSGRLVPKQIIGLGIGVQMAVAFYELYNENLSERNGRLSPFPLPSSPKMAAADIRKMAAAYRAKRSAAA
jgi:hypothetical protein